MRQDELSEPIAPVPCPTCGGLQYGYLVCTLCGCVAPYPLLHDPLNGGPLMPLPDPLEVTRAREAVTVLRDAARTGRVIEFRERDPLVMAIHDVLDRYVALAVPTARPDVAAALVEARKALFCLYIAVDAHVARDVESRVEAAFTALAPTLLRRAADLDEVIRQLRAAEGEYHYPAGLLARAADLLATYKGDPHATG